MSMGVFSSLSTVTWESDGFWGFARAGRASPTSVGPGVSSSLSAMARIGSEGGTESIVPGISHAATESQEGGMVNPASRQGYAGSLGQKRIERLGERLGLIEHDEVAAARYHLRLEEIGRAHV